MRVIGRLRRLVGVAGQVPGLAPMIAIWATENLFPRSQAATVEGDRALVVEQGEGATRQLIACSNVNINGAGSLFFTLAPVNADSPYAGFVRITGAQQVGGRILRVVMYDRAAFMTAPGAGNAATPTPSGS